jgi:hypothetical protein
MKIDTWTGTGDTFIEAISEAYERAEKILDYLSEHPENWRATHAAHAHVVYASEGNLHDEFTFALTITWLEGE